MRKGRNSVRQVGEGSGGMQEVRAREESNGRGVGKSAKESERVARRNGR